MLKVNSTPKAEPSEPRTSSSATPALRDAFRDAFIDIRSGLASWRIWTNLAWFDLRTRYKRSWIGIYWIALSFAIFGAIKIVIFSALSGRSDSFFAAYLMIGFLVYRVAANSITAGTNVFVSAQGWIKSESLPLSIYAYKLMMTLMITFFFCGIPTLITCIAVNQYSIALIASLPLLALVYCVTSFFTCIIFGVICARHRDLMHLLQSTMLVLYLITPILWVPPETGIRAMVAFYNPITHYIEIFRGPMLGQAFPMISWLIVAATTTILSIVGFVSFALNRNKIVYLSLIHI